jgi:hypothetical protein
MRCTQRVEVRSQAAALLIALGLALGAPRGAAGQAEPTSRLGLAGVGALGAHVGAASVEHAAEGHEAGLLMDLGWFRTPSFRLQAEVALMRATLSEFVETEDRVFEGDFFDLTSSLSLVLQVGSHRGRFAPYVLAGVGVHALSSAFESLAIDRRYNGNPFGSHVGAGARLWISGSGRSGLFAEVRRTLAEHVNRTSLRVGGLVFYNDLIRPSVGRVTPGQPGRSASPVNRATSGSARR